MQEANKKRLYKRIFWILFIFPFVTIATIFLLISIGKLGFMPTFEDLENPQNYVATEVISEDASILGTYYYQNRSFVNFSQISPNMINALVATEDIRYFKRTSVPISTDKKCVYFDNMSRSVPLDWNSVINSEIKMLQNTPSSKEWEKREANKFFLGQYREVPWAEHPMWSKWIMLEPQRHHFIHIPKAMNTRAVAYTRNNEEGTRDYQFIISPTKYFKTCMRNHITEEFREPVEEWLEIWWEYLANLG